MPWYQPTEVDDLIIVGIEFWLDKLPREEFVRLLVEAKYARGEVSEVSDLRQETRLSPWSVS